MMLFVGLILVSVYQSVKKHNDEHLVRLFVKELTTKGKRVMMDAMLEGMDILPEKITEVKRTIDTD